MPIGNSGSGAFFDLIEGPPIKVHRYGLVSLSEMAKVIWAPILWRLAVVLTEGLKINILCDTSSQA